MKPVYKRILLKLSGEGLMGDKSFGMSADIIKGLAEQVKPIHDCGVEVASLSAAATFSAAPKRLPRG